VELEAKEPEAGSLQHGKTDSPFSELYQMIKQSLETPRKPAVAAHQPQTPAAKSQTPKPPPGSITKVVVHAAATAAATAAAVAVSAPGKDEAKSGAVATAKSPKKCRKSLDATAAPVAAAVEEEAAPKRKTPKSSQGTPKTKRSSLPAETPAAPEANATPEEASPATPQEVVVCEVVAAQRVPAEKPKTPTRRKSQKVAPVASAAAEEQLDQPEAAGATATSEATTATPAPVMPSPRVSPRSVERNMKAQMKQKELEANAAARGKYTIRMM